MNSRLTSILATLALALLLNGCGPTDSIFPLYKPEDTAFDDRLLGSWQLVVTDADASDSDKDARWVFSHPEAGQFYDFKAGTVGAKGGLVAKARLVRLGNNLFIDFEGDSQKLDDPPNPDAVMPYPMITTHMMGRIELENDSLQIHLLGDNWVKKQVKAGTFSLACLDMGGGEILTAQPDDLRKFMQAHADDYGALSEEFRFTRAK
jgi:hypothetical protein